MNLSISRLKKLIFRRIDCESDSRLSYHCLFHTRDDVLPAVRLLAEEMGVGGEDFLLLETAALLHDIGYLYRYEQNEPIAVAFARTVLPEFGYTPAQISLVTKIILKTAMPQQPDTLLEKIMCDADLDSLGRNDFWRLSQNLRKELCAYGHVVAPGDWLSRQYDFLRGHRYFTSAARTRGEKGKEKNLRQLELMIQNLESE